ncbi:hypothetical protein [Pseudomonas sp. PSB11]|uniref:hypothetical protein n=1 Tax=Pseudomonas sp. PSB11 TaxID=2021969 RepID=UPI001660531C|nr:hypothetical protein [Pseudomonas sp. PSB11]
MNSQLRSILVRVGATMAGLIVFVIALLIMLIGSDVFTIVLQRATPLVAILLSPTNWPIVPGWKWIGGIVFWAYPACAGVLTMAFFWRGWPNAWRRALIYLSLIVLIAPMSWINYSASDQWLNVWVQAALNLGMAVFFLTIVYSLREINSKALDMKAIQSISILMLTSFGVFLPLFYTCVFLAYASGMVTHDQIQKINDQVPLLFAGGAGAVVTFLSNLESLRGRPVHDEKPKSGKD